MLLSKLFWQLKPFFFKGISQHWCSWEPDLKTAAPLTKKKKKKKERKEKKEGKKKKREEEKRFYLILSTIKINFKIQQEVINQKLKLPETTSELNNPEETLKWLFITYNAQ